MATDEIRNPEITLLNAALPKVQQELLRARNDQGHWVGRLAASSLSTATAISALSVFLREANPEDGAELRTRIDNGLTWLDASQNADGGFGDTDRSPSNIASSFLALAAWHLGGDPDHRTESIARLSSYIDSEDSWNGLRRRYGRDKTFVVPILSNCAIAGLVPWQRVPSLPFELAAFPHRMYRFLQMPVVSYAIPALVAIGQARFKHAWTWNPIAWLTRSLTRRRTLDVLRRMQPGSGGYLEATPLTSFVLMNLSSMGHADHSVSHKCVEFLLSSQLDDGSWPIDENLATWLTSLSLCGLARDTELDMKRVCTEQTLDWHLSCQHRSRHPFTGADPGGWGWTDLSGAVPDADDTPAAMLAQAEVLRRIDVDDAKRHQIESAITGGAAWLLGLQNRDGGWPTFCRGWGKLPFDRSGSDLTAHALRAINVIPIDTHESRIRAATKRGFEYLRKTQQADGSWLPLWFGNHDCPEDENKIYGTARVLLAYQDLDRCETSACQRGWDYLAGVQNPDGGWGGGASITTYLKQQGLPWQREQGKIAYTSSVEETAVVVEALADSGSEAHQATILKGIRYLCDAFEDGRCDHPWPIGFYFAKLWYHEKLYPLIFTAAALGRAQTCLRPSK